MTKKKGACRGSEQPPNFCPSAFRHCHSGERRSRRAAPRHTRANPSLRIRLAPALASNPNGLEDQIVGKSGQIFSSPPSPPDHKYQFWVDRPWTAGLNQSAVATGFTHDLPARAVLQRPPARRFHDRNINFRKEKTKKTIKKRDQFAWIKLCRLIWFLFVVR